MTEGRPQNTENKLPVRNQPSVFFYVCSAELCPVLKVKCNIQEAPARILSAPQDHKHPSPRLLLATVKRDQALSRTRQDESVS